MRLVIAALVIIAIVVGVRWLGEDGGAPLADLLDGASVEDRLAQVADAINAETPDRVDSVTTLTSASASGRTLTYTYTLDAAGAELDAPSFEAAARGAILAGVCNDLADVLRAGASLTYRYIDRNGRDFARITVGNGDC